MNAAMGKMTKDMNLLKGELGQMKEKLDLIDVMKGQIATLTGFMHSRLESERRRRKCEIGRGTINRTSLEHICRQ
uniref:Uncharacterized protein n=1 Tax=Meloidogyne incognita TaxID=6306 RepID=A0A914MZ39_MELIC